MCKDGLLRSEDDISKGLGTNSFPGLHCINDASVAKQVTAVLRSCLPIITKKHYSSKSLRKGTINIMAGHTDATVFSVCAHSGHTTGTTLESYLDKHNVLRGLSLYH